MHYRTKYLPPPINLILGKVDKYISICNKPSKELDELVVDANTICEHQGVVVLNVCR
jgi:hypothetical protein